MKRFYSQRTGLTYLDGLHPEMPDDVVELSETVFFNVIANPDPTKVRSHDKRGSPILIERPAPTSEELAVPERQWRDTELTLTDPVVARHRDQVEAMSKTTLSAKDTLELLRSDRPDQSRPFASYVAHGCVDLEPFEHLGGLTLVKHHRFGALLGIGPVNPFMGEFRIQIHGPPVVDVHHAAGTVRSIYHEALMFARAFIGAG